jgi:hypothetical protein
MRPSSAKAKGRRLQDYIRERLLDTFAQLEADDVKTAIMGESGEDIHLSPAARKLFPFSVEAKNQERLNIWQSWQQAVENTKEGSSPLLVFKRNRSEVLCVSRFEDVLATRAKVRELEEEVDRLEDDCSFYSSHYGDDI